MSEDDFTNVIEGSFDSADKVTSEPEETGEYNPDDDVVKALGINDKEFIYYSSRKKMVVSLLSDRHTELALLGMAGEYYWQYKAGEHNVGAEVGKIPWKKLAGSLMQLCCDKGYFRPDCIRGRGAWEDAGRTVFHTGDRLIVDSDEVRLGDLDSEFVYTQRLPMKDFDLKHSLEDNDARKIVQLAGRFRWQDPLHGKLLAGWLAHAVICGASDWRSHIWITGPTQSGKSTVATSFMHKLLGKDGAEFFQSAETTEAGIRQHMKNDAVPIVFDEFEADHKGVVPKVEKVLTLMRQASSETGGQIIKGTSTGESINYTMRSAFAMISIGVGMKHQADRNRVTILTLLGEDGANGVEEQQSWKKLSADLVETLTPEFCRAFRARMIELIPNFRLCQTRISNHIRAHFGDARIADQLGTLLAGFWLLTTSKVIDDEHATQLIAAYLPAMEELQADSGAVKDEEGVLEQILTQIVPAEGGDGRKFDRRIHELLLMATDTQSDGQISDKLADLALRRYGLRVDRPYEEEGYEWRLFVTNDPQLNRWFRDTQWSEGWYRQLERLVGAKKGSMRFHKGPRGTRRGISLPIEELLKGDFGGELPNLV